MDEDRVDIGERQRCLDHQPSLMERGSMERIGGSSRIRAAQCQALPRMVNRRHPFTFMKGWRLCRASRPHIGRKGDNMQTDNRVLDGMARFLHQRGGGGAVCSAAKWKP